MKKIFLGLLLAAAPAAVRAQMEVDTQFACSDVMSCAIPAANIAGSIPAADINNSSPTFGSETISNELKLSTMTSGSIPMFGANGTLIQDNAQFSYDLTNRYPILNNGSNGNNGIGLYFKGHLYDANQTLGIPAFTMNSAGSNYGHIGYSGANSVYALSAGGDINKMDLISVQWDGTTTLIQQSSFTNTSAIIAGTLQVTGQTNLPGIAFSSRTLTGTSAATSGFTCLANSTITWNSNGNWAAVTYSGDISNDTLAQYSEIILLLDGVALNGTTNFITERQMVGGYTNSVTQIYHFRTSSGIHRLCPVVFVTAGTTTIGASTLSGSEFSVQEF